MTSAGHTDALPPQWQVWSALVAVYVIWGSTYVAIRVMVEDVPPLLGAGARFAVAGGAMPPVLAGRRPRVRGPRRAPGARAPGGLALPAGGDGTISGAAPPPPDAPVA